MYTHTDRTAVELLIRGHEEINSSAASSPSGVRMLPNTWPACVRPLPAAVRGADCSCPRALFLANLGQTAYQRKADSCPVCRNRPANTANYPVLTPHRSG